jgi:hypothetical protein
MGPVEPVEVGAEIVQVEGVSMGALEA